MIVRKAVFVKSASKPEECPPATFSEFAMIGRSNVWKSSLINTLANNGTLSKTSIKPGKTQLMNFFLVNDERYLVDLPWYWYAVSGAKDRWYWIDTTHSYFLGRTSLKRVFVLVDWSISPQKIDLQFIQTLQEEGIHFDIIVTKIDKVNQKELNKNIQKLKDALDELLPRVPKIFLSSSTKKKWREDILNYIQDLMW